MKLGFEDLRNKVINRGLCTCCGTCVGVCPRKALEMVYVDEEPEPQLKGKCTQCGTCTAVCPGADIPMPEMEKFVFGRVRKSDENTMGIVRSCLRGYANTPEIRTKGASGGVVTGLLAYALEKGIIDCALVTVFDPKHVWRAVGMLAVTRDEIIGGAQSKYGVFTVNTLLQEVVDRGYKKLGCVGVPCHVHALRKIQLLNQPANIASRIKLVIGLYCGSGGYFEAIRHILSEWCGVDDLNSLASLDYRGGDWPGHMIVRTKDGQTQLVDRHQYVYHMALPAWKRDRCEMCIDYAAELADLAVGDYWNAGYGQKKLSSVVVRTKQGEELIEQAVADGKLVIEAIPAEDVTTGIGFELKKHGAAYRLLQRQRFGWPTPDYHFKPDYSPVRRPLHYAPERKQE